jgi:hypothetical protein
MIIGVTGRVEAFYIVILVSIIQFVHFTISNNFTALDTQVRLVYAVFTIVAFMLLPNLIFYWVLLFGTFMVVLFDRCMISNVLKLMPWNKNLK